MFFGLSPTNLQFATTGTPEPSAAATRSLPLTDAGSAPHHDREPRQNATEYKTYRCASPAPSGGGAGNSRDGGGLGAGGPPRPTSRRMSTIALSSAPKRN